MSFAGNVTVARNVLIVGRKGMGKSSIGNNILLKNAFHLAVLTEGTMVPFDSASVCLSNNDGISYELTLYDTKGLLKPPHESYVDDRVIADFKEHIENNMINLHLIIFVLRLLTDNDGNIIIRDDDLSAFKKMMHLFKSEKVKRISALALTHFDLILEDRPTQTKERIALEFQKIVKANEIIRFMGKGLYPVSFPLLVANDDKQHQIPIFSDSADRRDLLKLIEEANWPVYSKHIFKEQPSDERWQSICEPTKDNSGNSSGRNKRCLLM